MIIAIDGSADITEKLARELIKDFCKPIGPATFLLPYQDKDPAGLDNTFKALLTLQSACVTEIMLFLSFRQFTDGQDEKIFLVLGTEGLDGKVSTCHELNIPVYDLSRALYPVTEHDGN